MKKRSIAGVAAGVALAFALGAATAPAFAAVSWVSEPITCCDVFKEYDTEYYHDNYGTMGFDLTNVPPCGNYMRLGLRLGASATNQYTGTQSWNVSGFKYFYKNNVNTHTRGHYAFNGRLEGGGCATNQTWGGNFSY